MFIIETGYLGVLAWLAWNRLAAHLKENPKAVSALTNHVFIPLLGKKNQQ